MNNLVNAARKAGGLFDLMVKVSFDKSIGKYVVTNRSLIVYIGNKQGCDTYLKENALAFMVIRK